MLYQGGAGRGGEAAGALPPGPVQGHAGGQALPRPPCPAPRPPGKLSYKLSYKLSQLSLQPPAFLDSDIFDSLSPALVNFSLQPPGGREPVTSEDNISIQVMMMMIMSMMMMMMIMTQLVAETSSRLLFMSTSWAASVPVFRDMTHTLQVRKYVKHYQVLIPKSKSKMELGLSIIFFYTKLKD